MLGTVSDNWNQDIRAINFKPAPGMRIFVDAHPDHPHIIKSATEYVDKYWDASNEYSMRLTLHETCSTKEEAIQFFITEWTKPGNPTIIEVK